MSDSKVQYFGRFKNQYFEEKKVPSIQQLNILKDRGPIFFVSDWQTIFNSDIYFCSRVTVSI